MSVFSLGKAKEPGMATIRTRRLLLVPLQLELVQAAIGNRSKLAKLLGVGVPDEWPNADFGEVLPLIAATLTRKPALAEWDRLIIHAADNNVIGDIGLKGGPDKSGTADLGYGIVPAYRRQGYAFEAAQALVNWAFDQKNLSRLTADCLTDNQGSIRVLEKLSMRPLLPEDNLLKWELENPAYKRADD